MGKSGEMRYRYGKRGGAVCGVHVGGARGRTWLVRLTVVECQRPEKNWMERDREDVLLSV